jgi:thioesterase domain-containing protein/acyl carrier protein
MPDVLRSALSMVLPDYMVPATFIELDSLPLTLNGKVDVKALPLPDRDVSTSVVYEKPNGDIETKMASIWTDVLKIQQLGRSDNFFEAGGDSLSAMRLMSSLNQAFSVDLPLRTLFQYPTVKDLSIAVLAGPEVTRSRNLVPLRAGGDRSPLFVIHGLSGHVFHYMPIIRELEPNQPVYGLQATGLEEVEALDTSIEEMASAYVSAIRKQQGHGPYHLLGYSAGGLIAFEMAQQLRAMGEEVGLLALLDTSLPNPEMERTVSAETMIIEMANSLGLADMIAGADHLPSLAQLVEEARSAGRLPREFQIVHAERMSNIFRNMLQACPEYCVRPWNGSLLMLRAKDRPEIAGLETDWSAYVAKQTIIDLDCDHFDLIAKGMASKVAFELNQELEKNFSSQILAAHA